MNNYINQTPNMPMYNGYNNYRLPTYEVIKVNGRGGANAFQMGPNSSILLLDETDNIVWLAQTDGAGYKTVIPFDIVPHKEEQKVDMTYVINRIEALESSINELMEVQNAKSNFRSNSKTKQLYEDCYMSLINDNGAVFVASKVKELINDVGAELEEAISFWMPKKASDFSIEVILQEQ